MPDAIALQLVEKLTAGLKTLAVAESCTGGKISAAITSVPGSSKVFMGGLVSYSNTAKCDMLGVSAGLIEEHGAVSEEVALQMAAGARQRFGADFGLSVTGIAGPNGGTPEKPVGLVYVGLADSKSSMVSKLNLTGNRDEIQLETVAAALNLIIASLS